MTESRSIPKGVARWLARSADHVTRSDWHDRYADQCWPRGDDVGQCWLRGDDVGQYWLREDDVG